jgi:hypothetical protein
MAFCAFMAATILQPLRCVAANVFSENFDDTPAIDRWIADRGIWEIGVPTGGPKAAHSGSNVLATILPVKYTDDRAGRAEDPALVVPAAGVNPRLRFRH